MAAIALLLAIILLALFSKLRYDIKVDKGGLDDPWAYKAKISWLAFIVNLTMDEGGQPIARIFGIKTVLPQMGGEKKKKVSKKTKKPHPQQLRATETTEKRLEVAQERQKRKVAKRKRKQKRKNPNHWDKIKELYQQIGKDHLKEIISIALALVKNFIKKVMPKKFKLRGKFGTGEPDTTGLALGGVSVLSTVLDICVEGNFEEKDLQINLQARGGLRMFSVIWIFLRFWFNPEIKRLRDIIKVHNNKNKNIIAKGKGVEYGNRIKPKHG